MTSKPRLIIGSAVPVDRLSLLSATVAADSNGLLKIFQPRAAGLNPVDIVQRHRQDFTDDLHQHGAILLRGLEIPDVETFDAVVRSFSSEILEYNHKSTPRTNLGGGIYTSTEYPADQAIPLHNELSWTHQAPRYLSFCCLRPAQQGGATPIADSRLVFRSLPGALRAKFATHGISYVRNYHPEIDLPWQEVFHSEDRSEVEAYCSAQGMSCE